MNQTNSEMPISSFTLNELITMAGGEKRPGIMGECIAANSASEMEIFRFPSRLNALIIGVGTEGETSLTSNLQEFRLKKDSLFIFSPKHILQVQSNNRFKAHLIVIAPDFLKRINIDTKRMMPLFLQFGSLPCMELTQAESQSLRSFISMVEQELKGSETDFSSEIIGGLIAAGVGGFLHALKDFSLPISMSFRLFGALLSGALVTELVYYYAALSYVLPVIVGVMFTLLHALIQAYVLTMLVSTFYGESTEKHEKKPKAKKVKKSRSETAA